MYSVVSAFSPGIWIGEVGNFENIILDFAFASIVAIIHDKT